ncbi:AraC-type DNA-binding protein [Hydrocarboniphaga daqingensis]|jgi:AraC-like DNA-binding protein|uniref:AraC-type DNA-binding protein n=1 Tax=Hydrocarboniphaga daqingensis TaxID=490188 RepID=A0A1M5QFT1_9GAMM|nr:AraC family transcriptional regulator [Hydrocarboniphaga daqingensis]SHH12363.1 AraC-type DNA-binding protein [Hydrocarboniphaga daqingensis]
MQTLIRSHVLTGYRAVVRELGGDPDDLLDRHGVRVTESELVSSFVPYVSVLKLFEATATELDCPDFGLRLSRCQGLENLGPLALLVANCKTVRESLVTVARYMPTYSPAVVIEIDESQTGDAVNFVYDINLRIGAGLRRHQKAEFSLGIAMNVLRMLVSERFEAIDVLFRHESNLPAAVYRRYFGVVPRFGQMVNAIVLPRRCLDQPLALADQRMHGMVGEYLQPLIQAQAPPMEQHVEQMIARLLPTQQCRLSRVAEHLSMHPRTLQRHLDQRGRAFEDIVDEVRRERALEYLANPRMTISQVAGLIGYSEQSTFTRACHRWFQASPRAIRAGLQQAAS